MNKYVLCLALLVISFTVAAQKKGSKVTLISSESETGLQINGKSVVKTYKGVFQQESTILRSDSAYFYDRDNMVDAFSHVSITQGDTLHVFSDKLHYDGNTKIATLTDNVKMIDRDATLTTNDFTYNTATKIGTYANGGKLVNKDNTLTSKNGFYFSRTRDSYFRYNVVLNTVDAVIKTDTLRYNSGTRIAFFYGPTNIYGKDKDTLYTENGTYNTINEQAFFGKNNLYKKGTRSLKGDSLFYDRLKGYGRATKHVIFADREQRIEIRGGLGISTREDEHLLMTVHPYVVFITDDTVKTQTPVVKIRPLLPTGDTRSLGTIKLTAKDTLGSKGLLTKLNEKRPGLKTITDSLGNKGLLTNINDKIAGLKSIPLVKADSATIRKAAPVIISTLKNLPANVLQSADSLKAIVAANKKAPKAHRDSIYMAGDTIETQIITYQSLKIMQELRRIAATKDSSVDAPVDYSKPLKFIVLNPPKFFSDTELVHPNYFPRKKAVIDTTKKLVKKLVKLSPAVGVPKIDSVNLYRKITLSDTARVRILEVYHHAKIYKSDLQAKADSIFFSYADSTARLFVHPMIWAQESQMSGDTVNLQLLNKKVDNIELYPKAMIVNVDTKDSTNFNQVSGKKMRAFFKNSKLSVVYVSGSAETIFFKRDSTAHVTDMARSIASRMRINFKNNRIKDFTNYYKDEARDTPIGMVKEENKTLKNFIWKPKDRPASKEAVIGYADDDKKPTAKKKPQSRKPFVKPGENTGAGVLKLTPVPLKKDTLLPTKLKIDTLNPAKANQPKLNPQGNE